MWKFNVLPILFVTTLLVTRHCLGAPLNQSSANSSSYTPSQLLGALDIYLDALERTTVQAFRKYQTKYFAKRQQPYLNLQLIRLAKKNYSKDEQNDTAKGALFRISKLLSVFQSSVYLAWYDEAHSRGSVANTLKRLSFAVNDTLVTAMFLAVKLNFRPLPSEIQVSRQAMDRKVMAYKNIFKDKASVNSLRTWRTLYEMKYRLVNELAIQVKKLHNALSM